MGGSLGGKGDTGDEAVWRLACCWCWWKRGDDKYSVDCDAGPGSG